MSCGDSGFLSRCCGRAFLQINGVYAFLRRSSRGAMYFFLMPLGTAVWSIGYSAELLAPSVSSSMTAMDNLEFIGSDLVVIGFFSVCLALHKGFETAAVAAPVSGRSIRSFAWTDSGLLARESRSAGDGRGALPHIRLRTVDVVQHRCVLQPAS
jgi:hypothetical protein